MKALLKKSAQAGLRLLGVLALLGLCACAGGAPAGEEQPSPLPEGLLEPFTAADTDRMINLMSTNRALVTEDALYCFDYDEEYRPVLARYELGQDGLGARTVLAEDCLPAYLSLWEDRLYYVNGNDLESIGTDGRDRQSVRKGTGGFFQLVEGVLYFRDAEGRFCRAGLDGGGERAVLLERCCYPFLRGGILLYQSEEDGERLHLFRLEDGLDLPLTREAAYAPVIWSERLYYTAPGCLVSTDLDGLDRQERAVENLRGAAELLPEGESCRLRWTVEENGLKQKTAAPPPAAGRARPAGWDGYRLCDFAGDGWRVDAWYDTDGRLRSFFLTAPDGTVTEYLGGEVLSVTEGDR